MDLKNVKKCIVHKDCPDGVMTALLLRDALPEAEIQFVQYGTAEYKALRPEPGVLYADFSPPVRTRQAFNKEYVIDPADVDLLQAYRDAETIIIDHHPTAEPVVRAMGENGVFESAPGVCGATLVWEHIWSKQNPAVPRTVKDVDRSFKSEVRRMCELAAIRDTWQRDSPKWRDACAQAAVFLFYPAEHWFASSPYGRKLENIVHSQGMHRSLGEALLVQREREVQSCLDGAFRFVSRKGTKVVVFEGPKYSSDVAEALNANLWGCSKCDEQQPHRWKAGDEVRCRKCGNLGLYYPGKGPDLVIAFGYDVETITGTGEFAASHPDVLSGKRKIGETIPISGYSPKMRLSTRSHTGFDCAAFAKAHGGGGHKAAAGFNLGVSTEDRNPYRHIQDLVELYEADREEIRNK